MAIETKIPIIYLVGFKLCLTITGMKRRHIGDPFLSIKTRLTEKTKFMETTIRPNLKR